APSKRAGKTRKQHDDKPTHTPEMPSHERSSPVGSALYIVDKKVRKQATIAGLDTSSQALFLTLHQP
ncbi:MAG TPA: hypothetical protein VGX16_01330, partial [Solirubrobacteraceae bacterium]|nr:hypothetical protein [Solirubrobacteraceae bacterium]